MARTTAAPGTSGRGRGRVRVTEEREEIIRRGTGPAVVNRSSNTVEEETEGAVGEGAAGGGYLLNKRVSSCERKITKTSLK
jgi:hypothetical protein